MDMLMYGIMLAILLFAIWLDRRKYVNIGKIGEDIVSEELCKLPSEFVVLNNVRYRKCQIDHLVINHALKIIFVIEDKYWSGDISGDRYNRKLTQEINGQVNYFDNPIMQNEYHCKIVRQKYRGYSIRSIIVFVRCKSIPRHRCIVNEHGVYDFIIGVSNRVYNRGIIDGETDWLSQRLKDR